MENKICHDLLNVCQRIENVADRDNYLYFELSASIAIFFTELSRDYYNRILLASSNFPNEKVHYATKMTRSGVIINYMVANINDITLKKLADHFDYQKKYMSRLTKQLFSRTFTQLRRRLRIDIALSLLRSSTKSVKQISSDVGFLNLSTFYENIKKETGYSPAQYRKIYSDLT